MKQLLASITFIVFSFVALAGNSSQTIQGAINTVDSLSKAYPQEKVYLHLDNSSYYLGDTLWFKAYVVTAMWNSRTDWSKVLYVELLTQEGNLISEKKIHIEEGQGNGFFALKDSLRSGFYEVRAYTRWMLNFDEASVYSRVFPVFDEPVRQGLYRREMTPRRYEIPNNRPKEEKLSSLNISFFPEGGYMVLGLPCTIAFKATNDEGRSIPIFGNIRDASGNDVAMISVQHQGMGRFELPSGGMYTAYITYEGKEYKFPLPKPILSGYGLSVEAVRDLQNIRVSVRRSADLEADTIGLVFMCRGKVFGSCKSIVSQDGMVVSFPKKNLPSGVTQILLLDKRGIPIAERLVFVNHHSELKINAETDREYYGQTDPVKVSVDIKDSKGNPVETIFSLSVRDAAQDLHVQYGENILTNLLLSSELRGYIENPGYYFSSEGMIQKYALDLLMLTQGWTRYVWKDLASGNVNFKHPVEERICIDGHVQMLGSHKACSDVDVALWLIRSGNALRDKTKTDANGNFAISFDFEDTWNLSLQATLKEKRKNFNILLNRYFNPSCRRYSPLEYDIPEPYQSKAEHDSLVIREMRAGSGDSRYIDEVTIRKEKFNKEAQERKKASITYDVPYELDKIQDRGEMNYAHDIPSFLMHINPFFGQRGGDTSYMDFGNYSDSALNMTYKMHTVHFKVNNFEARDYVRPLGEMLLEQIKSIIIIEGDGLVYGGKGDEVIVMIYTFDDNKIDEDPKGIRCTTIDGYAITKEFYSPSYKNYKLLPGERDCRRTLYWNPNVKTDANGHAEVSFYNSSDCVKMNISAETVTETGAIGTTEMY